MQSWHNRFVMFISWILLELRGNAADYTQVTYCGGSKVTYCAIQGSSIDWFCLWSGYSRPRPPSWANWVLLNLRQQLISDKRASSVNFNRAYGWLWRRNFDFLVLDLALSLLSGAGKAIICLLSLSYILLSLIIRLIIIWLELIICGIIFNLFPCTISRKSTY